MGSEQSPGTAGEAAVEECELARILPAAVRGSLQTTPARSVQVDAEGPAQGGDRPDAVRRHGGGERRSRALAGWKEHREGGRGRQFTRE